MSYSIMKHKKTKKRKGQGSAAKRQASFKSQLYWAAQRKRHITPEYCRALITEFDRMLEDKERWDNNGNSSKIG